MKYVEQNHVLHRSLYSVGPRQRAGYWLVLYLIVGVLCLQVIVCAMNLLVLLAYSTVSTGQVSLSKESVPQIYRNLDRLGHMPYGISCICLSVTLSYIC